MAILPSSLSSHRSTRPQLSAADVVSTGSFACAVAAIVLSLAAALTGIVVIGLLAFFSILVGAAFFAVTGADIDDIDLDR